MTHGQKIALIEGDFFGPSPSAIPIGPGTLKNREPAQSPPRRQWRGLRRRQRDAPQLETLRLPFVL